MLVDSSNFSRFDRERVIKAASTTWMGSNISTWMLALMWVTVNLCWVPRKLVADDH